MSETKGEIIKRIYLTIPREIGEDNPQKTIEYYNKRCQQGQEQILICLGMACCALGNYAQAIKCNQ